MPTSSSGRGASGTASGASSTARSTPTLTDDEAAVTQSLLRDRSPPRSRTKASGDEGTERSDQLVSGKRKARERTASSSAWSATSAATSRRAEVPRVSAAEKISMAAVVVHLLKGNIGPGAMSLPNGFSKTGIYAGPVMFVLVALVSVYNMDLLLECKRLVSPNKPLSFGEVGRAILGHRGKTLIDVFLVGTQLGICCVYFTFVATNIHAVLPDDYQVVINERQLIFAVFPVLLLLSWVRTLQRITPFSSLANGAVLLGITIVFYFSIKYWHEHANDEESTERAARFNWRALPEFYGTAVYSFEGIGLILPIQNEMREPDRFPRVLAACMLAILVLFLLLGEIPTIAFGSITSGSMTAVLRDYCDGWLVPAANLLLAFACLLSFPIQFYPAIEVLERALNRHGALLRPSRDVQRKTGHRRHLSSSSLSSMATSSQTARRSEQNLHRLENQHQHQHHHHHHQHHHHHDEEDEPSIEDQLHQFKNNSDNGTSHVRISLTALQHMGQPPSSSAQQKVGSDASTPPLPPTGTPTSQIPQPPSRVESLCNMSQYECNRTIFRSMLCTSLMVVAVCVPDVGLLISLFGSVGSSMLAIILPPLLYIEAHGRTLPPSSLALHYGTALFGVVGMVAGTAQAVVQVLQSFGFFS